MFYFLFIASFFILFFTFIGIEIYKFLVFKKKEYQIIKEFSSFLNYTYLFYLGQKLLQFNLFLFFLEKGYSLYFGKFSFWNSLISLIYIIFILALSLIFLLGLINLIIVPCLENYITTFGDMDEKDISKESVLNILENNIQTNSLGVYVNLFCLIFFLLFPFERHLFNFSSSNSFFEPIVLYPLLNVFLIKYIGGYFTKIVDISGDSYGKLMEKNIGEGINNPFNKYDIFGDVIGDLFGRLNTMISVSLLFSYLIFSGDYISNYYNFLCFFGFFFNIYLLVFCFISSLFKNKTTSFFNLETFNYQKLLTLLLKVLLGFTLFLNLIQNTDSTLVKEFSIYNIFRIFSIILLPFSLELLYYSLCVFYYFRNTTNLVVSSLKNYRFHNNIITLFFGSIFGTLISLVFFCIYFFLSYYFFFDKDFFLTSIGFLINFPITEIIRIDSLGALTDVLQSFLDYELDIQKNIKKKTKQELRVDSRKTEKINSYFEELDYVGNYIKFHVKNLLSFFQLGAFLLIFLIQLPVEAEYKTKGTFQTVFDGIGVIEFSLQNIFIFVLFLKLIIGFLIFSLENLNFNSQKLIEQIYTKKTLKEKEEKLKINVFEKISGSLYKNVLVFIGLKISLLILFETTISQDINSLVFRRLIYFLIYFISSFISILANYFGALADNVKKQLELEKESKEIREKGITLDLIGDPLKDLVSPVFNFEFFFVSFLFLE